MASGKEKDYRSPGEILREARRDRDLSVEDVAETTKISPRMLAALESDEYEELAGPLYARSFLRTLSRFFSLDEADMFERLEKLDATASRPQIPVHLDADDETTAPQVPVPSTSAPEPEAPATWRVETVDSTQVKHINAKAAGGRGWVLWAALAVIVLLAVVWFLMSGDDGAPDMRSERGVPTRSAGRLPVSVAASESLATEEEGLEASTGAVREPAEALTPTTLPADHPVSSSAAPPDGGSEVDLARSGQTQPDEAGTPRDRGADQAGSPSQEAADGTRTGPEGKEEGVAGSQVSEGGEAQAPAPAPIREEELPAANPAEPEVGPSTQDADADSQELQVEEEKEEEGSGALGSIVRPGVQPPVAGEIRLEIRALSETELWFAADGGSRQRRRLAQGEVLQLTARDHFVVEFSEPEAVEAFVDGVRRAFPSEPNSEWLVYPDN